VDWKVTMQELEAFIVAAKAACYVGDGAKQDSSRLGSHDLGFTRGPFIYRDSYFGGTDFLGQEVVWQDSVPVWAMNYYGRILRADLIDGESAGKVIKAVLSTLYREGRFLGGFEMSIDGYSYTDTNSGNFESFTGIEWITRDGVECYRLDYAGGRVKA
jgi:hypothetical protein